MNNLESNPVQDQEWSSTIRLKFIPETATEDNPVSYPIRSARSRTEQLEELLLSFHQPETSVDTVIPRSVEPNNRQFARCPILAQRTSAILTVKGRSYDCQLIELSIGGFGVIVPGLPKLAIGADGKLRAPGLNYVVNITRQEIRQGGTFIGLRQVEEIVDNDLFLPNGYSPVVGYLIAAVAGALIATLMYCYKIGA